MTPYNTPRPSLFQRLLPDGRLHLQEGPIDLVIEGFGADKEVRRAYAAAVCFEDVLPGLVAELPALKQPVAEDSPVVQGPVARRMVAACRPHRRSEEHTSELQSLMRISYAVFCLEKK